MKITQFRGDLRTFRNLELEAGVEAMKSEVSRKRVEDLRISLPYLNPYNRSSQEEKLPGCRRRCWRVSDRAGGV